MVVPRIGDPLTQPIRVLVKGASTVNWISYMGGPRSDFAYPRVVEASLLAAGRPAVVRDTSLAAEHPKAALQAWSSEVVPWSPDVVILHYGHMECLHLLLPRTMQRYAQSFQYRPGPLRDFYRKRVVRRGWHALCRLQQRVTPLVPDVLFTRRARRAALDLSRAVERIQLVGSPLVMVMGLTTPGANYRAWFPGLEDRMAEMNDLLADVVRRADRAQVRHFPTEKVLAPLAAAGDPINPDGAHFTPAAHRAVGEAVASEIAVWIDQQSHLNQASAPTPTSVGRWAREDT